jgi:uncharacterized protein YgiM (DUF1202 family)
MDVSKKSLYTLWILAAIVAVALLAATLALAARARTYQILNDTVYLTSREVAVRLHQGPDAGSPVVAALVPGSAVTVLDVSSGDGQTWYHVQKGGMTPGWVPADHVRLNPP